MIRETGGQCADSVLYKAFHCLIVKSLATPLLRTVSLLPVALHNLNSQLVSVEAVDESHKYSVAN